MKQFVVNVLCDRKDVHPDSTEPAHEVWLINSKSQPVAVDLCDPCEKGTSIIEARELADAIGQPVELPGRRGRKPKPVAVTENVCDVTGCGLSFDTAQGLGMHRNKVHGIKGQGRAK